MSSARAKTFFEPTNLNYGRLSSGGAMRGRRLVGSSIFYNDNDRKAAAWMRELIAAGLIGAGSVDERSLQEITPQDVQGKGAAHFFAGIGGWELALQLAGWPGDRPVWTGSCPCQPFSVAGRQLAEKDARHVWPIWYELIAKCRPPVLFGEQVASKAGRSWLAGVRADLEALGYAVGAADLCSAGIGAPNIRQRLYWVAIANGNGQAAGRVDDEQVLGLQEAQRQSELGAAVPGGGGEVLRVSDTNLPEQYQRAPGGEQPLRDGDDGYREGLGISGGDELGRISGGAPGAQEEGQGGGEVDGAGGILPGPAGSAHGLEYAPSDRRQQWWTQSGWRRFELRRGQDGKVRRIEPGLEPLVNGLPGRVGLLRGYGNAINPWLAARFVASVMDVLGL